MNNVVDEVLAGSPRYTIKDDGGTTLYDNVQIDLKTQVTTAGTPLNKALFDSIQTDLNSRLLVSNKASQNEAQAGINDTKYMTPLKTENFLNAKLSIKTGTVEHNSAIPQTAGFANYMYFVSPNDTFLSTYSQPNSASGNTRLRIRLECSVNQSTRVVTCRIGYGSTQSSSGNPTMTYTNGTANYIEFAWG